MTDIVLTAAFDRAKNAIAVAELVQRKNVKISAVLVVSSLNFKRIRSYIRQRGLGFAVTAVSRLVGMERKLGQVGPMDEYLVQNQIQDRSLKKWCRRNNVEYRVVKSINDDDATTIISRLNPDWLVYCGGGILRRAVIEAANGNVLNAHAGPLPEIRGFNACEWAIILQQRLEATIHQIDTGIDTGAIIKGVRYQLEEHDTIETVRQKAVVAGVCGLVQVLTDQNVDLKRQQAVNIRQCFAIAPAIKELLQKKIESMSCGNDLT